MSYDVDVGKIGETIACSYLKKKNYSVLTTNFRNKYGEIDIIAQKDTTLIFCEVKTRTQTIQGLPYQAVDYYKIRRIQKLAQMYVLTHVRHSIQLRIDVISILLSKTQKLRSIRHFKNITM